MNILPVLLYMYFKTTMIINFIKLHYHIIIIRNL